MSAIQRWYFTEDGFRREPWDDQDEQWCKAKDVADLERLIMAYLQTITALRDEQREIMRSWSTACRERETLRTELQQALKHIESLDAQLDDAADGYIPIWGAKVVQP